MSDTKVKICGLTRLDDAQLAADLGAAMLGCNLYEGSSRFVPPELAARLLAAKPASAHWVAILVNPSADYVRKACRQAPFDLLQFHGDEPAAFCEAMSAELGLPYIKAIRAGSPEQIQARAREYPSAEFILLDAVAGGQFGGTGKTFDWQQIPEISQPLMLAGGLDPDNVSEAIRQVQPDAVDLASGVEASPGIKDYAKLRAFMAAVKSSSADAASMSAADATTLATTSERIAAPAADAVPHAKKVTMRVTTQVSSDEPETVDAR